MSEEKNNKEAKKEESNKKEQSSPVGHQSKKESKNKTLWVILGLVFGVIFLCCCCCAGFFGLGAMTIDRAYNEISTNLTRLCDLNENELNTAYNEYFTANYRRENSFSEFVEFYNSNIDYFAACDFEGKSIWDNLTSGNVNFSTSSGEESALELSLTTPEGTLLVEAVQVGDSWLIDDLRVAR